MNFIVDETDIGDEEEGFISEENTNVLIRVIVMINCIYCCCTFL